MTPETWEKVNEIFHAACDLAPAERSEYVNKACGNDALLIHEVQSLLSAGTAADDSFMGPLVPDFPKTGETAVPQSLIGSDLGHYRIEQSIGSGGMGEVYLATDTRLNRKVALKTLPAAFAGDKSFLKRFRNEAQAAANLNHPNVATIYSVEDLNGRPVITMEYVEGQTLNEVTPSTGLDLATFLDWFTCLSDALAHAHERGVVHRDIKPGNIMITPNGVPKILDFGLARLDETTVDPLHTTITQPGQIIGTPSYMSPEQAEGKEIDHRTDIFSFGVVMYEVLTGRRPFTGDSNAEIVSNLLKSEPPPMGPLRPGLPAEVVRLINRCLNKMPRSRFHSMDDVNAILSALWANTSRSGQRSNSVRRLYREFNPASTRWIFAAALFVVVCAVAAKLYFSAGTSDQQIVFENMSHRKLSQSNDVVYAHITPDGRSIVYNTIGEDEKRSMWIRQVDDRNALQLLPPKEVSFWGGLSISPDSGQIYYITADWSARNGTLYKISSLGGQPRKLVDTVNDLGSPSPDGERLLIVRYGDEVQIISVRASDGTDERVIHAVSKDVILRDPQFSTDGTRIYFSQVENVGRDEQWSLAEIPAGGGTARIILAPRKERINEIAVLSSGGGLLVNQEDPVSKHNQIYYVDPAARAEKRITNDINSYFGLSVSRDGRSIVAAQRQFSKHVWVGDPGSENSFKRITREPTANLSAVWTADGRVVFDAVDNNIPHIWIADQDGENSQQLTPNDSTDYEPRITPDGRFVVFVSERTGDRKIWRMNIDGSNPTQLTQVEGHAYEPRIMADREHVLFKWTKQDGVTLGKVAIAGGGPVEEMPLYSKGYWALSGAGDQVAYSIREGPGSPIKVAIRRLAEAVPYVTLDIAPIHVFKWVDNDKGLLFRQIEGGPDPYATLWLWDLVRGEKTIFYSAKPDNVFDASLSPDGKRIATVQGRLITDAVMLTNIAR